MVPVLEPNRSVRQGVKARSRTHRVVHKRRDEACTGAPELGGLSDRDIQADWDRATGSRRVRAARGGPLLAECQGRRPRFAAGAPL